MKYFRVAALACGCGIFAITQSGPDLHQRGTTIHTLWVANDNDFLSTTTDAAGNTISNPNQFFVFGFTDADLGGSKFVPQQVEGFDE